MQSDELAARGVRVKALEWEDRGGFYIAKTPWGRYAVGMRGELCIWAWNGDDRPAETPEAAKAAAQSDYESRILAALELVG